MLSDFLMVNGGLEIKRSCGIRNHIWDSMLNNERPPSIRLFNSIVKHLGKGNATREKAYKEALWREILKLTPLSRSINMKIMKEPMAAPRPRFVMSGRFPRVYNPPKYTLWKRQFALLVGNMGTIVGPCKIHVEYHELSKTKPLGPHQKQSDIDNFDKAFLDALQLNGLLNNDMDVFSMNSHKYSSYESCVTFRIWYDSITTNEKGLL